MASGAKHARSMSVAAIRWVCAGLALCISAALAALTAPAMAENPLDKRDFAILDRDCRAGDAKSCAQIKLRFSVGRGVEKNPAKAAEYEELACLADDAFACARYVGNSNQRAAGYPAPAPERLSKYAAKGCDLGNMATCLMAKQYARKGYYTEQKRIALLGKDYKAVAKPAGVSAPASTAVASATSPKPAPEPKVASSGNRFLDECNSGSYASCHNYGLMLGHRKDYAGAYAYALKACQMKGDQDCAYAKALAAAQERRATQLIGRSSLAELKRGCDAGDAFGCARYAYDMGEAGNWGEAVKYTEKGCKLGNADACSNIPGFKSRYARLGNEQERAASREWYLKNARETGYYAGAIGYLLKKDRHVPTLGALISAGGAKGMQPLSFAEVEDLALNYPDTSHAAWGIIQSEWQRRGGPQLVRRQQADEQARADRQRREAMYQPESATSGRRSNSSATASGSPGNSSPPASRPKVCTESYAGGGSGVNGKGQRIVTCR